MNYDNPDAPRPLSQEDLALARNLSEVRELRQFFFANLNSSLRAVLATATGELLAMNLIRLKW